jgi:hypothetical protein
MKTKQIILIIVTFLASVSLTKAQKVYSVTSGEMIFSLANVEFTQEFLDTYEGASVKGSPLRFTMFFHLGQYWHMDFGNNIGLISGIAMRNVGLISDETLPEQYDPVNVNYINYKIIRRTYTLGIPLMLKLGSFKDHFYFFGGAEYELAFQHKEKYWTNTHDRSGTKTKSSTWFGSQFPTFLPSLVGGIQMPGGFNLKFKWYLTDFLNHEYDAGRNSNTTTYSVSDLTRYKTSQVFYFSLSWQFNTAYITKKEWQTSDFARR